MPSTKVALWEINKEDFVHKEILMGNSWEIKHR